MLWGAGVGALGLTLMILKDVVAAGARIDNDAVASVVVLGPLFGSLGGLFIAVVGGLWILLDTDARIARGRALILTVIMTPPLCLSFFLLMQPDSIPLSPLLSFMVIVTVLGSLASRAVLSMSGPWTPHGPVVGSSA